MENRARRSISSNNSTLTSSTESLKERKEGEDKVKWTLRDLAKEINESVSNNTKDTGYSTFRPTKGENLDPSSSYHLNSLYHSHRSRSRRSRSKLSSAEKEPYFQDIIRERRLLRRFSPFRIGSRNRSRSRPRSYERSGRYSQRYRFLNRTPRPPFAGPFFHPATMGSQRRHWRSKSSSSEREPYFQDSRRERDRIRRYDKINSSRRRSKSSSSEREPYFQDSRRERERLHRIRKYDKINSSRRRSRSYSRSRSRSRNRHRRRRSRDRRRSRSYERSSRSIRRSRSSDRYDSHYNRTIIHVPQYPPPHFAGPWAPPMHFPPIRPGLPPPYVYGHPMPMGPIPPQFFHHPHHRFNKPYHRPYHSRNYNKSRKDSSSSSQT